jgi:Rps23 Pro-64 3,4-dihydroxylase Tpa1-like proline 4-hydroxylase
MEDDEVGEKKKDKHSSARGDCDSPATKRLKLLDDDSRNSNNVFAPTIQSSLLLSKDAVGALAARYASAVPYPYVIIKDALDRTFLDACVTEIKDHSRVDFKESDLFKFYQSMDLASVGGVGTGNGTVADVPHVVRLREILYSAEWRRTVEKIVGLDPNTLTDQVDCACNCHANTCHLLCHDDVIRTRKVSYILYLVDDEWSPADGGALELYASSTPLPSASSNNGIKVPETFPCIRETPKYNALCLFGVEPGVSFHSVQEVTCTRSPRLSLQGWYHWGESADDSNGLQRATLRQLKTMRDENRSRKDNDDDDAYQEYEEDPEDDDATASSDSLSPNSEELLSSRDRAYLSLYLDPSYLQPRALREMRERFEATSSLQLRGLFLPSWAQPVQTALLAEDQGLVASASPIDGPDFYHRGVGGGWKAVGPPHMRRYLRYDAPEQSNVRPTSEPLTNSKTSTAGALLFDLRRVLQSSAFARFLERVTGLSAVTGYKGEIRRFRPGRDYTVAHYGLLRPACVLDATLVFCAGTGDPVDESTPDSHPDVQWQSGDVGGFECYIEVDETGEDEKYKSTSLTQAEERGSKEQEDEDDHDEDNTELLSVSAANNTLSLVYRDPGTMRFVKYVSYRAPSSRWDISMEYRVTSSDGDDEEEDDEGGDDDDPDSCRS